MNKKGSIPELAIVFMFLALVTYGLVQAHSWRTAEGFEPKTLGDIQLATLRTYQQGEETLFYIDQVALYSAYAAFTQLALHGGFVAPSCGKEQNYNLWATSEKKLDECFPQYKENAVDLFKKTFDAFVAKAPDSVRLLSLDKSIRSDMYSISVYGDTVTGTTSQSKLFSESINKKSVEYAANPSFEVSTGYNLNDYEVLKKQANNITRLCSGLACIKEQLQKFSGWSRNNACDFSNFIACFGVTSEAQFPFYGQLAYKFALFIDFPAVEITSVTKRGAENIYVVEFVPSRKSDVEKYVVLISAPDGNALSVSFNKEDFIIKSGLMLNEMELEVGKCHDYSTKVYCVMPFTTVRDDISFTIHSENNEGRLSGNGNE